jgi:hypothetical protein
VTRSCSAAALAACAALAAIGAPAARAADECAGLMVCIPVSGPWVVVPGSSARASWLLRCPRGAVGGTDARVSDRRLDVSFPGRVGSPVGPGVTVADRLAFDGRYVGVPRRTTSFQPFLGCVPGGGGQRTPTAAPSPGPPAVVAAATPLRPGQPLTLRVRTLRLRPGSLARGSLSCREGERLQRAAAAVGLRLPHVPSAAQLAAVRVVRTVRDGRVLISATRRGLPDGVRVDVQIQAECAR